MVTTQAQLHSFPFEVHTVCAVWSIVCVRDGNALVTSIMLSCSVSPPRSQLVSVQTPRAGPNEKLQVVTFEHLSQLAVKEHLVAQIVSLCDETEAAETAGQRQL